MSALYSVSAMRGVDAFFQLVADEEERSARLLRPFAILRIEARAAVETGSELVALYRAVAGALRRTDRVQAVGGRELAALLTEADAPQADAALARVRRALDAHGGRFRARFGAACARPAAGDTWQEAWAMAGALLVADGAVPAAA